MLENFKARSEVKISHSVNLIENKYQQIKTFGGD